jgi:16S rRNA C1402 N4-methylase RsmH
MSRGFSGDDEDLHYTKSGDLDMRYTSSREAVASGFSSYPSGEEVSSNDLGSGYSSYGEELHYKKDGTLDMRYTSSREASGQEAVASGFSSYPSGEEVSSNDLGSGYSSYGEELHYKKDGTLDMRYTSSREASGQEAVASGFSSYPSGEEVSSNDLGSGYSSYGEELHYKKDGTLDMRYTSSREASGYPSSSASSSTSSDPLHYKQDGSLDMRYSSSKAADATAEFNTSTGDDLHFKKDGSLDMRFNSSKIAGQPVASSQSGDLHYKKDGSLDMRYNSSKVASGLSNDLKKNAADII